MIKLRNRDKTLINIWESGTGMITNRRIEKNWILGNNTFVQREAAGTEWPTYLEILMATPATEETKLAMKNKVYCF